MPLNLLPGMTFKVSSNMEELSEKDRQREVSVRKNLEIQNYLLLSKKGDSTTMNHKRLYQMILRTFTQCSQRKPFFTACVFYSVQVARVLKENDVFHGFSHAPPSQV